MLHPNPFSSVDRRMIDIMASKNRLPRISFGIIVLNGEPFTRYNLRALYPFAHEIIVVEGANESAKAIASPSGHSIDGTLDVLHRIKAEEDHENKIMIVTAEDEGYEDGFWSGEKLEQSQAYAKRATGDWLWQVDIDEFYKPKDMMWICNNLLNMPDVYAISFKQIQFWGGLNWYTDGWYLHSGGEVFHRLFRWQFGFTYSSHRPPTVLNETGIDLRNIGWANAQSLAKRGVFLYHYSLVFPDQVHKKSEYYCSVDWGTFDHMKDWTRNSYDTLGKPYRVHNVYQHPSWLEWYRGSHPPEILSMWEDVVNRRLDTAIDLRDTSDIEKLLRKWSYRFGRIVLKVIGPIVNTGKDFASALFKYLPESYKKHVRRALKGRERC